MGELDGRVALLVADSALSEPLARTLGGAGCTVYAATDIEVGGARLGSRDMGLGELAQHVTAEAGRLDILVQHAPTLARGSASDIGDDDWQRDLAIVSGYLEVARGFARVCEPHGAIVNLVSNDITMASYGRTTAAVVSNAVVGLTRALAVEWATRPIRVNVVAHGVILTDDEKAAIAAGHASTERTLLRAPSHRLGELDEVCDLVQFLVGPGSDFITGQVIWADGGWSALTQHPEGLRFP
jgi:NAD(P)-dependent dehydrogenase (short-subunit alcohol dehydrogenase family)